MRPSKAAWPECVDVAARYGKRWQSMSAERLRKMDRCVIQVTLPDWYPETWRPHHCLAQSIHGYMWRHREESRGFDPLKHLTPKSLFALENFNTNFEAFCEAWEQGWRPPQKKGDRWVKRRSLTTPNPPAAESTTLATEDDTEMVPIGQVAANLGRILREGK